MRTGRGPRPSRPSRASGSSGSRTRSSSASTSSSFVAKWLYSAIGTAPSCGRDRAHAQRVEAVRRRRPRRASRMTVGRQRPARAARARRVGFLLIVPLTAVDVRRTLVITTYIHYEEGTMNAKLTASLLIVAAVLANVAFTALGSIFELPRRAQRSPRRRARAISAPSRPRWPRGSPSWRSRGAVRADRDRRPPALLEPGDADRGAGRDRGRRRAGRRPAALAGPRPRLRVRRGEHERGVAAAARDSFTTASDILGTAIGETLGYAPHRDVDRLVIVALGRPRRRPLVRRPRCSAALVLAGVLVAVRTAVIDIANFIGYVREARP